MSKQKLYPYTMLVPGLLLFTVFFIIPTFQGMYYSFTAWDGFTARWVGMENFQSFFMQSELTKIVKNTILFTIVTSIFKVLFGLILAVLLSRKWTAVGYVQTIFYAPVILSNIAVGLIFVSLLHPETGIVNMTLRGIGLENLVRDWLHDRTIALYSASAVEIWKWSGFNMIILLAGIQTISGSYYEAANIDGATAWQKFIHITFPLIMPAFNNILLLNLIGGLKVFDIIFATTGGGPGTATEVINTWIYKSYGSGFLGEASAGGFILAFMVALVAVPTFSLLRRREVEL
ncbi:carbohydrate ABC transporter permease [Paenibacillus nasutitermitis]|uniref:Sugar ABC transporter permease n=1 Tax=Paenibacillus nasutitermitis TaxID=1652958 RepID=A0A916YLY1_9BACL|nr:sugar ABC transporter permease [Paenibacillus nasutitermitis]GGD50081.1 sugar ABC transporter permease [Paenibacillus nasutitermitis]